MTYDIQRWQGFAESMAQRYGSTGTVRFADGGETPARFLWVEYDDAERDGDIIRDMDRRAIISTKGLTGEPQPDDRLVDGASLSWRIVTVKPVGPSGTVVAYIAQVRR